ncbi:MAG: sugar ABC transporter ATP-binding protein [Limnochordia bacterium]|jgi:simple sugar transport system ATP-binding protein|nr:sugar ABC transporter ATP-binding protein [Bacillota bacterium]HAI53120.1 lipase [Bacillota bacterium]
MTRSDLILKLSSISKYYGGVVALDGVDFSLQRGEVHCLVGENGSGKSTLIKIISGVVAPEPGAVIEVDGRRITHHSPRESLERGIQVIYQDLSLFPNLTVAENIEGVQHFNRRGLMNWKQVREAAVRALDKIGVQLDPHALVGDLSIADRQLVAIARALAFDAKLVIMDEPTASLTRSEVDALLKVVRDLSSKGITILFVSHRLDEVLEIAQRVTVLRDGKIVGVYNAEEVDLQSLPKLMTGRAISSEKVPASTKTDQVLLEVRKLSKAENFKEISFTVSRGEILGITGLLGSGRTELALALFGMNRPDSGEILLEGKPLRLSSNRDAIAAGIAYVPEDRISQGLVMPQSVENNISITTITELCGRLGLIDPAAKGREAAQWSENLDIKMADLSAAVNTLSGGNQQRVVLAKWMSIDPKLLILDSPTAGVDVAAKDGIYSLIRGLAERGIAVILISDEADEVLLNSHRVLIMNRGRILEEIDPSKIGVKELNERIHATAN